MSALLYRTYCVEQQPALPTRRISNSRAGRVTEMKEEGFVSLSVDFCSCLYCCCCCKTGRSLCGVGTWSPLFCLSRVSAESKRISIQLRVSEIKGPKRSRDERWRSFQNVFRHPWIILGKTRRTTSPFLQMLVVWPDGYMICSIFGHLQ